MAVYASVVKNLKESQWAKILDGAMKHMQMYSMRSISSGSLSDVPVYDLTGEDSDTVDPAKLAALDQDSDLE